MVMARKVEKHWCVHLYWWGGGVKPTFRGVNPEWKTESEEQKLQ